MEDFPNQYWWSSFDQQLYALRSALSQAGVAKVGYHRNSKSTWKFAGALAELCDDDELLDLVSKFPRAAIQAHDDASRYKKLIEAGDGGNAANFPSCDGKPFYELAGIVQAALELELID